MIAQEINGREPIMNYGKVYRKTWYLQSIPSFSCLYRQLLSLRLIHVMTPKVTDQWQNRCIMSRDIIANHMPNTYYEMHRASGTGLKMANVDVIGTKTNISAMPKHVPKLKN
jgi:hypothetical protein